MNTNSVYLYNISFGCLFLFLMYKYLGMELLDCNKAYIHIITLSQIIIFIPVEVCENSSCSISSPAPGNHLKFCFSEGCVLITHCG